jgi:hypothetical protein
MPDLLSLLVLAKNIGLLLLLIIIIFLLRLLLIMSDASNRGLLSAIHIDVERITEARIDLSERGACNRRHATAVPILMEKLHSCFEKDLARYKMIR